MSDKEDETPVGGPEDVNSEPVGGPEDVAQEPQAEEPPTEQSKRAVLGLACAIFR